MILRRCLSTSVDLAAHGECREVVCGLPDALARPLGTVSGRSLSATVRSGLRPE